MSQARSKCVNIPLVYMRSFKKHDMWEVHTRDGYYYIHYDLGLWILKHAKHHWSGSYVYFDNDRDSFLLLNSHMIYRCKV